MIVLDDQSPIRMFEVTDTVALLGAPDHNDGNFWNVGLSV